jgi:hypothetical protein
MSLPVISFDGLEVRLWPLEMSITIHQRNHQDQKQKQPRHTTHDIASTINKPNEREPIAYKSVARILLPTSRNQRHSNCLPRNPNRL